jgi:hypothetical protein
VRGALRNWKTLDRVPVQVQYSTVQSHHSCVSDVNNVVVLKPNPSVHMVHIEDASIPSPLVQSVF